MIDKDYLIDNITEEKILDILSKHGALPFGAIKPKEIWFKTICHGGDSHKLCYFRESKSFYCYTNCGKMSLFSLIMKIKNCNFTEAIFFIASEMGISNRKGFNHSQSNVNLDMAQINTYLNMRRKQNDKTIQQPPKLDTSILSYFEDDVFYEGWIDEGISIPTMQKFGIRWYELEKHIIIPHENIENGLIGIRRRSLQEKDKNNKYMPEIIEGKMYSHSLNLNLYGLNKHIQGIKKTKKIVIVESEKSVLLAYEYYQENAFVVATCGFNISNWQRDIILSLGVDEVIIGFDKDFNESDFENCDINSKKYKEYMRYVARIYSLAHKFTAFCRTYVLWDNLNLLDIKNSPFDKGKNTLELLMKNKIEITTEREEEYNY